MGKIADALRGAGLPEQTRKQVLSLDVEFSNMEVEITTLKAENLKLQAKVNPLEREVGRLKEQIAGMESRAAKIHIEHVESQILVLLSEAPPLNAAQVASNLEIHATKAQYHLTRLAELRFVLGTHFAIASKPTTYSLLQPGREYLVKNDLVK